MAHQKISTSKKILLIQTAFIGDVVLATPLIEKLKTQYPDCKIDFLLRKGNEGLFEGHPHLNKVLAFDKKEQKYRRLWELIRTIRATDYDVVINVQRFFTTGLITCFSGAKNKIGFDKNPWSFFFTKSVPHRIETTGKIVHEVERNIALLEGLADLNFVRPKLYPSAEDYKIVPSQDYICIAPASVWFTKQLPLERWVGMIQKIPTTYKIFLLGAPSDTTLCQEIQEKSQHPSVEILAGKLTFLQSAALMQHAKMNFANDSAPLHFASAVNAPMTAVFCSTVPAFGFGPLSDNAHIVQVAENLSCRPCGLHGKNACPEGHFKCSEIEVLPMDFFSVVAN